MIVPKYTAQAPRNTGVAGQPGVKVPGGALSQAAAAQGSLFANLSQEASKWGAVSYKMHRDAVVTKAVNAATAGIDGALIEAQRQDIADPKYAQQGGGIVGYFEDAVTTLQKTATSTSFDPITNSRIASKVGAYAQNQRRVLNNYNAGRIVDLKKANLNQGYDSYVKAAANALDPAWDGNEWSLPVAALSAISDSQNEQLDAARSGVITAVAAQAKNRGMRNEIASYAVNTRITAATTTEHTEALLDLLGDPKKFRWLEPDERDRLTRTVITKRDRLIGREFRDDQRRVKAANKALGGRQTQRLTGFITRITQSKNGDAPPVTEDQLLRVAEMDGGQGLKPGDLQMLLGMVNDFGPKVSDPTFINDLYRDVYSIDDDLGDQERAAIVDGVIARSSKQVGLGEFSRITVDKHLAFMKWAEGVKTGSVDVDAINRARNRVLVSVVPRNDIGMYPDARDAITEQRADNFFSLQITRGATPTEAFNDTLQRFGIVAEEGRAKRQSKNDPLRPPYPVGLPASFPSPVGSVMLKLPTDTTEWTVADVERSKQWVISNQAAESFGRNPREKLDRYKRLMDDLDKISAYIALGTN